MKFKRFGLIILAALVILGFLLAKPIKVTLSTLFFLPQVFPQIPVKPLNWFSGIPLKENVEFFTNGKLVTGYLFRSSNEKPAPALILAMAVRTAEKDQPVMENFARSLAQIGFVTAVVNRDDLQKLKIRIEEKETFISSFKYLQEKPFVDKNKITFVGISVGSSIALKAAQNPEISDKVKALVFFGGYFDVTDYFASLLTKSAKYQDIEHPWKPADHVLNHFKEVVISLAPEKEHEILTKVLKEDLKLTQVEFSQLSPQSQFALKAFEAKNRQEFYQILESAPSEIKEFLENISPNFGIEKVKTRIFILHDRKDPNVPYFESRKLAAALPKNVKRTQLEVSLFEHVQPEKGLSWSQIGGLIKLYGFIWQIVFFVT